MKTLIFLSVLGCFCLGLAETLDTLLTLQVIFRHGYRHPLGLSWTDNDTCASSYDELSETQGNLTTLGETQMKLFGLFLRIRYNRFIGDSPKIVHVKYSNCSRDQESAELVYEGLFKGFNDTEPNLVILDKSIEGEMATSDDLFNAWLESLPWNSQAKEHCSGLNKVKTLSCQNRTDYYNFVDQMISEQAVPECTLPPWLDSDVQDNFVKENNDVFGSFQLCSSKKFVEDNSDGMLKWMNDVFKNDSEPSAHLYASHDMNIAVVLTRMGVFDGLPVNFGAAVFFEKHTIKDKKIIRLYYDNSVDYSDIQKLKLPGCDWDCPYDTFVKIVTGSYPCSHSLALRSEPIGPITLTIISMASILVSFLLAKVRC